MRIAIVALTFALTATPALAQQTTPDAAVKAAFPASSADWASRLNGDETMKACSAALPDVPTVAESGFPGFEFGAYLALFAPAGTPKEAIAILEDAVAKAIQVPLVKERLAQMAAEPVPVSAAAFQKYFNDDVERFARLVREGKIKPLN